MTAIFKREMKAYFSSAIGYVFLAVFLFFAGYFFFIGNVMQQTSSMSSFFNNIVFIFMFLLPILTMRLLSEDKKNKTDQILLTSPVSVYGIVFGKFFAALAVYGIGLSSAVIFGILMAAMANVQGFVIVGNLVAMLLVGAALISIGLFISGLTESQVIAAVVSFFIMLLLFLIDNFSKSTNAVLSAVANALSITGHYTNFSMGIFNIPDAIFYLSIAAIFLFLTFRVLEKRRWS